MTKPTRLIRIADVIDRTGISKATIYRRIKSGDFPAPVSLAKDKRNLNRMSAWCEQEIENWIQQLTDAA